MNDSGPIPLSEDRRRLVDEHRGLAAALAWSIAQRLPRTVDTEDLVSLGQVGLVKAAHTYDPSKGAAFGTYAYQRARGEILDGLRRMSWFDAAQFEAGSYDHHEQEAEPDGYDATASSFEFRNVLHNALGTLPPSEFDLLRLHYFEGLSLAQAADHLGISRSWASRLHGRALDALRDTLKLRPT